MLAGKLLRLDDGAEPPPPLTPPANPPLAPSSIDPPPCDDPETDPDADEGKGRGKGDADPEPDEVVDTLGEESDPKAGVGKLSDDTDAPGPALSVRLGLRVPARLELRLEAPLELSPPLLALPAGRNAGSGKALRAAGKGLVCAPPPAAAPPPSPMPTPLTPALCVAEEGLRCGAVAALATVANGERKAMVGGRTGRAHRPPLLDRATTAAAGSQASSRDSTEPTPALYYTTTATLADVHSGCGCVSTEPRLDRSKASMQSLFQRRIRL